MVYEKKYNNLVAAIKQLQEAHPSDEGIQKWVEDNVPELAESEDERIKKVIADIIKAQPSDSLFNGTKEKCLAWLEKQGEQKPAELSLPYGKNKTAEKLIALAECLEMDGDCLFNELSGNDYGKLLRVLAIELTEVKSSWSEEDSFMLAQAIKCVNNSGKLDVPTEEIEDWLKSIKERVYHKTNIASDEELAQAKKDAYNDALDKIEYHSGEPTFDDGWSAAIRYVQLTLVPLWMQ